MKRFFTLYLVVLIVTTLGLSFAYAKEEIVQLPNGKWVQKTIKETSNKPSANTAYRSVTSENINKMTTYAVVLGRAVACGIDTSDETKRVGSWMDRIFPPGSKDQRIYLPIFMGGVQLNAKKQANGESPDSCNTVRNEYFKMPWP